jgi:hypothetical protein
VYDALYRHDFHRAPEERLVLLEKIALGPDRPSEGPLTVARQLINELENDVERLEQVLEQERRDICGDALAIDLGTTVLTEINGKPARLVVEDMYFHVGDDGELNFRLSGPRYRKDGVLGKRWESIHIKATASTA